MEVVALKVHMGRLNQIIVHTNLLSNPLTSKMNFPHLQQSHKLFYFYFGP